MTQANPVGSPESNQAGGEAMFDAAITRRNETDRAFPDQLLLQELFEQRVALQPDATAACAGRHSVSYRELDKRANQVAHALRALGCQPGDFVGSSFGWGLSLLIAQVAILKAGASYVPLDPTYPATRRALILADARIRLVLTDESRRSDFFECQVLDPSNVDLLTGYPETALPRSAKATDIAYAMYTSGTTGTPNGVLVSHRAVVNTLDWVARTFALTPADRLLSVSAPTFDLSVFDMFGVLGAGATLVFPEEVDILDPSAIRRLLVEARITLWNSTPGLLGTLAHAWPELVSNHLRLVLLSGDWIPLALPQVLRRCFPHTRIVSLGGATEAAIWSNWYVIESVAADWVSIPYGVPIQNCRYHVLDSAMQPLPVGVAGDLYIGGVCLAEGYLNREQLTAERFVPDPFRLGQRLYATGDRAEYFPNGELKLLGRKDSQVKIRGFRVELGEVQAAVARLADVREATIITYRDDSGLALAAFVVLQPGAPFDSARLRRELSEELPRYAVPLRIEALDVMPLSAHGKVNHRALQERLAQAPVSQVIARPTTELERQVVAIWERVLGRQPVSLDDDFFAIGGNSLLGVNVAARLAGELHLKVTAHDLIAHPTIAGLLRALAANDKRSLFLKLNTGGRATQPPLVFFPGLYGTLVDFHALPRLFNEQQPVYMADSFHIADKAQASVGNIAARYIQELLSNADTTLRTERTPYVLCGFSFGSLTAFETAYRMTLAGHRVSALVSLDGYAPGYPEFLPLGPRLRAHLEEFAFGERSAYLRQRAIGIRRRAMRAIGREDALSSKALGASPEVHDHFRTIFETNLRASQTYRPQGVFHGPMLLLRTQVPQPWIGIRKQDPLYGWARYVKGPISVVEIPGDHHTFFSEGNSLRVVAAISEFIARVTKG